MTRASVVLLTAMLAVPAMAQAPQKAAPTPTAKPAPSPAATSPAATSPPGPVVCGPLKGESTRTGSGTQWTIDTPAGKTVENGALRSGPRFECLGGKVLAVEFTSTAGHSFFEAYFADGTTIGYGRQQIDKRGSRYVLPVQAKARMPEADRGLFDYHCKLNMPADPITPAARADCPN
jgi:hypothetical protein